MRGAAMIRVRAGLGARPGTHTPATATIRWVRRDVKHSSRRAHPTHEGIYSVFPLSQLKARAGLELRTGRGRRTLRQLPWTKRKPLKRS